jgi:hypothetical protein
MNMGFATTLATLWIHVIIGLAVIAAIGVARVRITSLSLN